MPTANALTEQSTEEVQTDPPAVEAPSNVEVQDVEPTPVIKWQDNPNQCSSQQWISKEPPFNCIDKPKEVARTTTTATTNLSSNKQSLMQQAGIPQNQWAAVDYIISKESGWRHTAWNGAGSGAYGLCQSLPASKMASAGADYMTNPVTQLKWCNGYANARYGGWWGAYNFWTKNHWW